MTCEELDQGTWRVDLALNDLSGPSGLEAARHLASCEACRSELEATRRRLRTLRHLPRGKPIPAEVLAPAVEAPPPLPRALEARLLAIPGDPASLARDPSVALEGLGSHDRSRAPARMSKPGHSTSSFWRHARTAALAACAAVALFVYLRPDPDLLKGTASSDLSGLEASIRLELVHYGPDGGLKRLELEPLAGGAQGVVVRAGEAVLPVLLSPGIDLAAMPYHVTVVALRSDGARVLSRSTAAAPVRRLPGTSHLYALSAPVRIEPAPATTPTGPDLQRLFVLLTTRPLPEGALTSASSAGSGMPGALPPGTLPAGELSPRALPPRELPRDALPPGELPPGALPPGELPSSELPPRELPRDALPAGALPSGALPPGAVPASALPDVRTPRALLDPASRAGLGALEATMLLEVR